ncbi:MAG: MbnP family protein [Bacteroidota bacterium]
MKNFIPLVLLLSIFAACEDKDAQEGSLSLQFQLTYDGEPLAMYDEQAYADNQSIFFDRFNLFLSNGNLIKDGTENFAFDVLFLNFSDIQDKDSAEKGLEVLLTDIQAGEYTALELGIGLAPEWNATTPEDYSSSHPLSNNYWSQWDSYIFTVIEGKADPDGDGMHDVALTYHIGKDENFYPRTFAMPITIEGGKTTSFQFTLDLKEVFENAEGSLDVAANPVDHSTKPEVYEFLMENLVETLKLKQL